VLEHFGRNVAHDGMGLDMEVSQYDVGLPVANALDDVAIDLCVHECHATIITQGAADTSSSQRPIPGPMRRTAWCNNDVMSWALTAHSWLL
jgi:hypothetical protein